MQPYELDEQGKVSLTTGAGPGLVRREADASDTSRSWQRG